MAGIFVCVFLLFGPWYGSALSKEEVVQRNTLQVLRQLRSMGIDLTAGGPSLRANGEFENEPRPSLNLEAIGKTPFVYAHPLPGAILVSPLTTIAFRPKDKVDRESIQGKISVRGNVSGDHDGETRLLSDNRTVYFTPNEAFTPGETISISVEKGIKTTIGRSLADSGWSFEVSWQDVNKYRATHQRMVANTSQSTREAEKAAARESFDCATETAWDGEFYAPNCAYRTLPDNYPRVKVTVRGNMSELSSGYLFTSGPAKSQLIMTSTADPVYWHLHDEETPHLELTADKKLASWFWSGRNGGSVLGSDYGVRHSFNIHHRGALNGHEFQLGRNGNALMFRDDFELLNITEIHPKMEPAKGVFGIVLQEVTNEGHVILEWRSWDHLPFGFWEGDNFIREGLWDIFHPNAIEEAKDGNILLSMRRMSQIAKIDRDTGEVLWRLGGKGSNFRIVNDERGQFYGQHDVREVKKNRISMFDNGLHSETGTSRGVEYDLIFDSDGHPFEARLVYSYDTATRVYAHGSYRRMPNGNGVYCLGLEGTKWQLRGPGPFYVETRHGKELIRMDWTADADRLQLGGTYRTLKGPWTGTPTWPPAVVLDDKNPSNTLRLHFSWNGATTVKKWRIMRGETVSELIDVLAEVEKKQFEHWVDILGGTHKCQYFQAVALDGEGKELKRSKVLGLAACDL